MANKQLKKNHILCPNTPQVKKNIRIFTVKDASEHDYLLSCIARSKKQILTY